MGATKSEKFVSTVRPYDNYSTADDAIKALGKVYEKETLLEKAKVSGSDLANEIRRKFADAAKAQERFNQRMRRVDLTRSAVQRRAFFESEQTTSGAMRSTTGMA